uniref:Uncharacterized protein n=1 Tax=Anopheles maculatus TaxID=74869 RepID=A0A182SI62_9DIPT
MDISKSLKKSGVASKRAKAVWDRFEKEWEAENQQGPSAVSVGQVLTSEQQDANEVPNTLLEGLDTYLEADETNEDSDDGLLENEWNESASETEEANIDADSNESSKPPNYILDVNISVDGLPLHNSGPTQLWPILMQVKNVPDIPIMILGIFCGAAKPDSIEDFLRPLVDEINHILVAVEVTLLVTFTTFCMYHQK